MKVHIHGWFGFQNLGDDLLLEKAVRVLESVPDVSRVEVAAKEHEYLYDYLGNDQLVDFTKRNVLTLFSSAMRNDALVVGPGGLFPHRNPAKVFVYCLVTLWWKLLGKKVAYFGLGATAIQDKLSSACWSLIAKMSDAFLTRDNDLFDACRMQATKTVRPCADLVFLKDPKTIKSECSDEHIAVAFANLYHDDEVGYEEFLDDCCLVVAELANKERIVELLSFTAGKDERLNRDIAKRFLSGGVVFVSYMESLKKTPCFDKYKLVLGMRFHSCVLAMGGGVPLVAVSYAHKTERLMSSFGMPENCVRYCKDAKSYYEQVIPMDVAKVVWLCNKALSSPSDFQTDPEKVREFELRARAMADILCEVLS